LVAVGACREYDGETYYLIRPALIETRWVIRASVCSNCQRCYRGWSGPATARPAPLLDCLLRRHGDPAGARYVRVPSQLARADVARVGPVDAVLVRAGISVQSVAVVVGRESAAS